LILVVKLSQLTLEKYINQLLNYCIMRPKKILSATAKSLQFTEVKKVSTSARINELINLLNLDREIYKFRAMLRQADRIQRNKNLS
jgi:hypothetical protein